MPVTVLLVEDERDIADLVRYHRERDGLRCVHAPEGATALRLARAERPDLLIRDLMLPGLAGLEVCRQLRGDRSTRVVAPVGKMLEHRASQKGQALAPAVPPGLGVRADRDRLVPIRVTLVDNAIEFTPDGGCIRIAAGPPAPDRGAVRIVDTGVGIASTDLPRIPERFSRADRARSRELGGTGLGLAIVKHLVHGHGGELRVDRALGRETTVSVTLPAEAEGRPT